MTRIIDGKAVALSIRGNLKKEVEIFRKQNGFAPGLATVLVGENPASKVYVKSKNKACEEAGMVSEQIVLSDATSEKELLELVGRLNENPKIHGILVQLPLPKQIRSDKILNAISPAKDVDGFHPVNVGNLVAGNPCLKSCTPFGIMKLIESIKYDLTGKNAVVVGRSNIVGKPVALMLLAAHATVTICHSKTGNLPDIVRRADLVVAAIGRPAFVKGDWIKPGAVVIDVGINRLPDGKLVGDVEFDEASKRASAITPVPGGVGPMTIAMLLWNTLEAAKG